MPSLSYIQSIFLFFYKSSWHPVSLVIRQTCKTMVFKIHFNSFGEKDAACLSLLSIAVIKHWQCPCGEERAYLAYTPHHSLSLREARAGAWRQGLKQDRQGVLGCSPWFAHLVFLFGPEPPAQGYHCPQWTAPSHINH